MKKIFEVAKWEFLEKIKTRAFIFSIILTPILIIGFTAAPAFFSESGSESTRAIGILDPTNKYFFTLRTELEEYKLENGQPSYIIINLHNRQKSISGMKHSADSLVIKGRIDGYLFISNGNILKAQYRTAETGSVKDQKIIEDALNLAKIRLALYDAGLQEEVIDEINNKVKVDPVIINNGGSETSPDFITLFFSSFILILLLMMMILYSGGMLIRTLLEEKSNRLIEILISSCTADELLTGKIIGLSALGLFQVLIWAIVIAVTAGTELIHIDNFANILPMLIYFLLGFVFYTSLFVGVGSIASTEQEAQQLTSYLTLLLLVPIVFVLTAVQNSDSILIKVLSYIPFTTPSIMILRLNLHEITAGEITITIFIMVFSIYITILGTARIFRLGILSYGKRPSVKELIAWLRDK